MFFRYRFLVLTLLALLPILVFGQAAIINEWSQGASGNKEWVEILVVQDHLDMRGWTLRDGSTPSPSGIITFLASNPVWSDLRAGTLIVVYNGADRDGVMPADELTVGTNKRIIAAHNNATMFTVTTAWIAFGNSTATDTPILMDASPAIVHDWDQTNTTTFTTSPPRPGSGQYTYYISDTAVGVSTPANWTRGAYATTSPTPGSGNGGINSTWISSLQGVVTPPSASALTRTLMNPAPSTPFEVRAVVAGTIAGATVNVWYSVDGGAEQSAALTDMGGNIWAGNIPGQASGVLVSYYIRANNPGSSDSRFPSSGYHNVRIYPATPIDGLVVITEFRYLASTSVDFVEIYNNTNYSVDMSYWKLWDNSPRSFDFTAGTTLASGASMVFTNNITGFNTDYPTFSGSLYPVAMPFGLNTGPTGDIIRLYDVNGNTIDSLAYTNGTNWPTRLVTNNESLELGDPDLDNTNPANWFVSAIVGGTPGARNTAWYFRRLGTILSNDQLPQDPWTPTIPSDPRTNNQPPVRIVLPGQTGGYTNPNSITITHTDTRPAGVTELMLPSAYTLRRFWTIDAVGGNFRGATLQINFTAADLPVGVPDPVNAVPPLRAGYSTDGGNTWGWAPIDNIVDNGTYYTATISNRNHFSIWSLGNSGVLPVLMTSFNAIAGDQRVTLNWHVESELGNDHFLIYRSTNEQERGSVVHTVTGRGTAAEPMNYHFVDSDVRNGTRYYYHIADVSITGVETVHPMVVFATPSATETAVPSSYSLAQNHPNPFNPTTEISFGLPEAGFVSLAVYDLTGREVASLVNGNRTAGRYTVQFDGSSLPSGVYLYRLQTGNYMETRKLTLVK